MLCGMLAVSFDFDHDATVSYLQIRVYLIAPVSDTDEQTPRHNPYPCNAPPLRVANVGLAFHAWTETCDIYPLCPPVHAFDWRQAVYG